jgi:CheY-like chemotaxis protein
MAAATILIVDDDVAIRDLLSEVFELEGYRVETAANGAIVRFRP